MTLTYCHELPPSVNFFYYKFKILNSLCNMHICLIYFVSCISPNTGIWSRHLAIFVLLSKWTLGNCTYNISCRWKAGLHLSSVEVYHRLLVFWTWQRMLHRIFTCDPYPLILISGMNFARVCWGFIKQSFMFQFANSDNVYLIPGSVTEGWVSESQLDVFQHISLAEFSRVHMHVLVCHRLCLQP